MGKKSKNEEAAEEEGTIEYLLTPQGEGSLDEVQCRLHLLSLSKEILEHQSHLMWETHKEVVNVSIDDVVTGASKLLDFAIGNN
jgi:hypothetical protein